jgi:hypothetical protein
LIKLHRLVANSDWFLDHAFVMSLNQIWLKYDPNASIWSCVLLFFSSASIEVTPEWHLLKLLRVAVLKDFFARLRPRFHQSWVGFWSFFHSSWFDPAGTVAHALFGDQHK